MWNLSLIYSYTAWVPGSFKYPDILYSSIWANPLYVSMGTCRRPLAYPIDLWVEQPGSSLYMVNVTISLLDLRGISPFKCIASGKPLLKSWWFPLQVFISFIHTTETSPFQWLLSDVYPPTLGLFDSIFFTLVEIIFLFYLHSLCRLRYLWFHNWYVWALHLFYACPVACINPCSAPRLPLQGYAGVQRTEGLRLHTHWILCHLSKLTFLLVAAFLGAFIKSLGIN